MFNRLHQHSNSIALISDEAGEITYAELIANAARIGNHIKERCLVFIVCTNCVESIYGYVGFLGANTATMLIHENFDEKLFEQVLGVYKPEFIYRPKINLDNIKGYSVVDQFLTYTLLSRDRPERPRIHQDLTLLMTTSGTTGSRKVVRLTKDNVTTNADSIAKYLDIRNDDRAITTMPMSYSYGLSIINSHLYTGASIVVTDATLFNRKFWNLWDRCNPTNFGGVPYLYEILMKLDFEGKFLSNLRYITQAGGRLRSQLAKEIVEMCKRKGVKMYFMYGQTEAAPRMGYLPWASVNKIGSIGVSIPSGNFSLEDKKGNVIEAADIIGELVYQGPNVFMGYAESAEDLAKGDENNGILRTGDLAKRDEDGFYYLVGRKSRFVKLFGNRIDLDELEDVMSLSGCECACIGDDENLRIFVTDRNYIGAAEAVLSRLGINRKATQIIEIPEIPRNEFGKITYSELALKQLT